MPIIGIALGAVELIASLLDPVMNAVEDVTDAIEQELGDEEIKKRYQVLLAAQSKLGANLSKERTTLRHFKMSTDEKIAILRARYGN